MLRHLVIPPQKTEPKRILRSRYLVIIVSLLFLLGSFVVLCVKMIREQPSISTSLTSISDIFAPGKKNSLLDKVEK